MPFYFLWVIVFLTSAVSALPPHENQGSDELQKMRAINPRLPEPIAIDRDRVQAAGIQSLAGKHVTVYTDIRNRDDITELTKVFDAAVPRWCAYFDVDPSRARHWKLRSMLMADRQRFAQAKLLPHDLPNFLAGYQRGHETWVDLQQGNYYTRHLFLHEGTHSFMQWFLGGTGAPWYTEGMAELLAVHAWDSDGLKLNFRLTDRSQAEYWGRIKIIREDCAAGQPMTLRDVLNIQPRAFREVRNYAWSWAACNFLSSHPQSREPFSNLAHSVSLDPQAFNQLFLKSIAPVHAELQRDWNLYIQEIDFGIDVDRGGIRPAAASKRNLFLVDSQFGWQQTTIDVKAGDRFKIRAKDRFIVAESAEETWPSEPDGITIDYYRGEPLGKLMVGILGPDGQTSGLHKGIPVGTEKTVRFQKAGTICVRINESPARLRDNRGQIRVSIQKQ